MNKSKITYLLNILLPCVVFSALTGTLTAVIIFLFKISSSSLISLSGRIYSAARADAKLIPLLLIGAILAGLASALLLRKARECRGGGIPTAIAALRGYVPVKKISNLVTVFISSMLTYLCGIPLGTEGPSVQIGTLTGKLTSKLFGSRHPAFERYIMTGGACAGFGAATGAPLTGIFFAFEEAHRRFSPMIFMIASMSVAVCTAVTELLCSAFDVSPFLFHFNIESVLPMKYLWIPLLVGVICGFLATLLTIAYRFMRKLNRKLSAIPFILRIMSVFLLSSVIGLLSGNFIGTGHSLIDELIEGNGTWYLLPIYLCVRAIMMIVSNTQGITGGLFVPNLAFGAIIGAICGKITVLLGILPREYYVIIVIIGMVSFLSASSRTPITALTFGIEALSGLSNILPITVGVTFAFIVIESMGIPSFTDSVIESKTEEYNHGLEIQTIDAYFTVCENSFVIGKEIRDILWPPSCVIVSVNNAISAARIGSGMAEGDVLHVHCRTSHPEITANDLEALFGKQSFDVASCSAPYAESKQVPDA